jgi:hypothetical protein
MRGRMRRWVPIVIAAALWIGTGTGALLLPTRYACVSAGFPEGGANCELRRIEFRDHGEWVAIHVDERTPLRLAIFGAGSLAAFLLLLKWSILEGPTEGSPEPH